jgi:hypothetical protein
MKKLNGSILLHDAVEFGPSIPNQQQGIPACVGFGKEEVLSTNMGEIV